MIISASRRTDLPAFYSPWLMNRIRAGFCLVPNPFNRRQVSEVSLKTEDVDLFVFWTRNPQPLFSSLKELDERGYRYYFQFTLMNNPRSIDPRCPPPEVSLRTFHRLADRIGPDRVIWRYDPILFTSVTDVEHHRLSYEHIARALRGHTYRSVISIAHLYRKIQGRLRALEKQGVALVQAGHEALSRLIPAMSEAARENGMELTCCADETGLQRYGARPGKCVDDGLISRVFGLSPAAAKDPSQRKECGCAVSKDIGMYDSCLFECQYCYATSSFDSARRSHAAHDPGSPSLLSGTTPSPKEGPLVSHDP